MAVSSLFTSEFSSSEIGLLPGLSVFITNLTVIAVSTVSTVSAVSAVSAVSTVSTVGTVSIVSTGLRVFITNLMEGVGLFCWVSGVGLWGVGGGGVA
jgi:hypothetical protein